MSAFTTMLGASRMWVFILLISGVLILSRRGISQREGKLKKLYENFLPIILALPFVSLFGIISETLDNDPFITILAVLILVCLSLLFESLILKNSAKEYLPYLISSVIVGSLMEVSGYMKDYWDYPDIATLIMVILVGYITFFYIARKIDKSIRIAVEGI